MTLFINNYVEFFIAVQYLTKALQYCGKCMKYIVTFQKDNFYSRNITVRKRILRFYALRLLFAKQLTYYLKT